MVRASKCMRATLGVALGALALACGSKPPSNGGGSGSSGGASGLPGGFILDNEADAFGAAGASGSTSGGAGSQTSGGGSSGDLDAGSYPAITFPFDPVRITPDACASIRAEATERRRPMDIIVSIDNSSSMDSEIAEVQSRINQNFYDILEQSGIDYRVIMVSRYGSVDLAVGESDNPVHISPPLGGSTCTTGANPCQPLTFPAHGKFYHYSADIESHDMWQKLLGGLFSPDELQSSSNVRDGGDQFFPWTVLAPNGYDAFLREGSFKVFVGISDDDISGNEFASGAPNGATWNFSSSGDQAAEALEFDTALRRISPEHFGAAGEERNYCYYAIAGFSTPGYAPLDPSAAVVTTLCNDDGNAGVNAGQSQQELARLTGGLRYASCRTSNYDPIFTAIAQAVVEGAAVPCEFEIPPPPGGELIDLDRMAVTWLHGAASEDISRVSACSGAGYRLDFSSDAGSQPQRIVLCQDSCQAVQADVSSRISVDFGCIGQ